jgi:hypothetical protein
MAVAQIPNPAIQPAFSMLNDRHKACHGSQKTPPPERQANGCYTMDSQPNNMRYGASYRNHQQQTPHSGWQDMYRKPMLVHGPALAAARLAIQLPGI